MDNYFSAKEPFLGYLYQIQYGLHLLLSHNKEKNIKLFIENLDDIDIVLDGQAELFQAKYHVKNEANLTDRSPDFWKTIRIWSEQIKSNQIDVEETTFSLITTQKISNNSIILDIKNKKNVNSILKKLHEIAIEKTNIVNQKGYEAFMQLSEILQTKLIEKINIIDSSLDFTLIEANIKSELRLSVLPNQIQGMYERLEGWFLDNCILHLQNKKKFISFEEVQNKIIYIADTFKKDNLPIDFPDKILPNKAELEDTNIMNFIKQLNLIDASPRMLESAISDYYRAFGQRSKWIKDDLVNPQEEIEYDNKLIDEWERKFDLLLDESENLSENDKKEHGSIFYKNNYVKSIPQVFIRDRFQENYLTIGSCQMLSDKLKIGWYPDFKSILKVNNDT